MAGTADDFKPPNPPKLELPADFVRRLNLPPDLAERLKALMPPGLAQKFQRLARSTRPLTPDIREMIILILEKRRELQQLESWLDEQVDRERWDPAARAAAPSSVPALVAPTSEPTAALTPELVAEGPPPPETAKGHARRAQQEIARAVAKLYDGVPPPSPFGASDLKHAIERLQKTEAKARNEKPSDPPSWDSCDRFLREKRGLDT
jgi:hypothetical protein